MKMIWCDILMITEANELEKIQKNLTEEANKNGFSDILQKQIYDRVQRALPSCEWHSNSLTLSTAMTQFADVKRVEHQTLYFRISWKILEFFE